MGFYDELSKVYDIVFERDEDTVNFLSKDLKVGATVLDIACGTGTYADELAKKGCIVEGVDLDNEMIRLAEKKKGKLSVNFSVGDMRELKFMFEGEKYDLIYCIGNSLVHLQNRLEIQNFIKHCYNKLNQEGRVVIQIINFDRILKEDIRALPTIDRKEAGVKFIRNYRHREDNSIIYFETELQVSKGGEKEVYKNSVPLLPVQSEEIESFMKSAGFRDIQLYGGFKEQNYNEDSYALVIQGSR